MRIRDKFLFITTMLLFLLTLNYGSQVNAGKNLNGFDLSNSIVPRKYIDHGGPPRDGIPAIYDPHYVDATSATFLKSDDIVLGFEYHGHVFAYPRYILNWHELVNGRVGEFPFLISYCPLCGTGMAFSSIVGDHELDFGVSGLLYNSDVIFYDKNTESLWSQMERRAISGKFVGAELDQLYLQTTTWSAWLEMHPNTMVLSEQQGIKRNYRHDPYGGYETSSALFFKTMRQAPKEYHTKERVLGVTVSGIAKAFPYVELRRMDKTMFIDNIAGNDYRIRWNAESETASIESLAGEKVVSATTAYWFAWYSFHPKTEVFRAPIK